MSQHEKERAFLHDLSNPLAIAHGLIEVVVDETKGGTPLTPVQIQRLEKVLVAMERIKELMKERRKELLDDDSTGAA